VKFDFLGLKTLTVIQNAVDLLRPDAAWRGFAARYHIGHPAG
jgi:DNA polymerase III alpha subunit